MSIESALLPQNLRRLLYLGLWISCCILIGAVCGFYSESYIPILIALTVIGFLVFMAMDVALYAMLICWPFSFRYILPSQMEVQTPTEPLLGMLVSAFIVQQIFNRVIWRERSNRKDDSFPLGLPVLCFILTIFLPTLNAPQIFVSAKGAMRTMVYVMLSFLVYDTIRIRQDLKRLFISTVPSASIAVVWTMVILIYNIDKWQWTSAYYGSPFTNYTAYGAFTGVFL